jgi:hypothetical protein
MTQESSRQLSDFEKAVIHRLLEADFQGRGEVQEQISHATASLIEGTRDNYGSINIYTSSDRKANVKDRVPVMGMTKDEAGGPIEILLHVVNGIVNELEFVRMDGQPMVGLPRLDILELQVRGE